MPETESLVDRYRPNGHKGSLLFSLLLLALSLVAQVSLARDYLTVDGQFTLCKWNKIKDCELLDAKRERLLDLTKDERKTLHALRRFSEATSFTGQDVLNAFGKPHYSNRDGDELQLIWRLSVPHERGESTVGTTSPRF